VFIIPIAPTINDIAAIAVKKSETELRVEVTLAWSAC